MNAKMAAEVPQAGLSFHQKKGIVLQLSQLCGIRIHCPGEPAKAQESNCDAISKQAAKSRHGQLEKYLKNVVFFLF
jgi:hypothetical protein